MDDEWEDEEQLVVAELSGMIDSDALKRGCGGWCKVVGLDSEQPVLQLGRYVFAGEYEDAVGTSVIFQEEAEERGDPICSRALRYKCHTAKKLILQRTFLSERKEGEPGCRGGIEVLSLNERDLCGRSTAVCHYAPDPSELERTRAEVEDSGPVVSEESDAEMADTEQKSANESSSKLDMPETAASDDIVAEPGRAEEHQ